MLLMVEKGIRGGIFYWVYRYMYRCNLQETSDFVITVAFCNKIDAICNNCRIL